MTASSSSTTWTANVTNNTNTVVTPSTTAVANTSKAEINSTAYNSGATTLKVETVTPVEILKTAGPFQTATTGGPTEAITTTTETPTTPTPSGPIVGGVLGGLAFFVIISLLVYIIYRLKHRKLPQYIVADAEKKYDSYCHPIANEGLTNDDVFLGERLHKGKYTSIHIGEINAKGFPSKVAVKKLIDGCSDDVIASYDKLVKFYISQSVHKHPNVVCCVGVTDHVKEPYILLEYCEGGKLSDWLRKQAKESEKGHVLEKPIKMALDLASGMAHLSNYGIHHGHLRAGNVLLTGTSPTPKITAFAPSVSSKREVPEEKLAVHWVAPEKMKDTRMVNEKSDVWSFAMVLWEIFTFGAKPFENVNVNNLYHQIQRGTRPKKPAGCPPFLYGLMEAGWQLKPEVRPPFSEFEKTLNEHYAAGEDDTYYHAINIG